jgi:hypothetical protein
MRNSVTADEGHPAALALVSPWDQHHDRGFQTSDLHKAFLAGFSAERRTL